MVKTQPNPAGTPTGSGRDDSAPALVAENIVKRYGGLAALKGVSASIPVGSRVGIVGPNGSGKTTLLNVLSGFSPMTSGTVHIEGRSVTGYGADRIARLGVSRTFQNLRLWAGLTVLENVRLGQYRLRKAGPPWERARRRQLDTELEEILDRLDLTELAFERVSELAYGIQKRVELGRALVAKPSVVLLDEPFAGMNSDEAAELLAIVMAEDGATRTVLVIEHNVRVLVESMDRLIVLDEGALLADGTPHEVVARADVRAAYLGPGWESTASTGSGVSA